MNPDSPSPDDASLPRWESPPAQVPPAPIRHDPLLGQFEQSKLPFSSDAPIEDTLVEAMARLQPQDVMQSVLREARETILDQKELIDQARSAIEQLEEAVEKVTSPANRLGIFLSRPQPETAHVFVGGSEYYCRIDPRLPKEKLRRGTRVMLNEAYAIVDILGFDTRGPVMKVTEVLEDGRLRIGGEAGTQSMILERSDVLLQAPFKAGDEVRVDPQYHVALEVLPDRKSRDHYLDVVPELPWEKIGGQEEALVAIRDAIELPLLHPELFARFTHATPKGFLLHGPPGCGKTLIGKATAYNLTSKLAEASGQDRREYFMHIKGPEILNMWVGESERMVREIFETARAKRSEGYLPFLFIDEAESILGTRRSSRHHSVLSTLVPMFCTEMDGIASLHDVVIILASNRADLIDPAILRPGRIDRKIKVKRPDKKAAEEIYGIYLSPELPFDADLLVEAGSAATARTQIVERLVESQFAKSEHNKFLEVTLRSGRRDVLYRGDLASGALMASVVERAKERAIKRAIATPEHEGLRWEDFEAALDAEYSESGIFPPLDLTEDWLKLIDYEVDQVVSLRALRESKDTPRPHRGMY